MCYANNYIITRGTMSGGAGHSGQARNLGVIIDGRLLFQQVVNDLEMAVAGGAVQCGQPVLVESGET